MHSRRQSVLFEMAIGSGAETAAILSEDVLTGREREVTDLASHGLSNREIADVLFLSVRTVESHLYQARIKTGVSPRGD